VLVDSTTAVRTAPPADPPEPFAPPVLPDEPPLRQFPPLPVELLPPLPYQATGRASGATFERQVLVDPPAPVEPPMFVESPALVDPPEPFDPLGAGHPPAPPDAPALPVYPRHPQSCCRHCRQLVLRLPHFPAATDGVPPLRRHASTRSSGTVHCVIRLLACHRSDLAAGM